MYCKKCGKELRQGDTYCSGCGQKVTDNPASSSGEDHTKIGCLVWLVIILAIAFFVTNRNDKADATKTEVTIPAATQSISLGKYSQPVEPFDGDVLEDSDYPDGTPRRRVRDYGDKQITDYRQDGTLLRDVTLYYSNGVYSAKRVTNYDSHGNPTDVTERMSDGELWLYLYYENEYTDDGRPFCLTEFNRAGYPLFSYIYMYYEDGTYSVNFDDFRGPVYEYDFETNPSGETFLFAYGYTKFDANGNVIDQMIEEVPESDR